MLFTNSLDVLKTAKVFRECTISAIYCNGYIFMFFVSFSHFPCDALKLRIGILSGIYKFRYIFQYHCYIIKKKSETLPSFVAIFFFRCRWLFLEVVFRTLRNLFYPKRKVYWRSSNSVKWGRYSIHGSRKRSFLIV